MRKVAIVMGSKTDLDQMKPAVDILKEFGVECEVRIISAHRTPDICKEFAETARERGVEVIIAGAGGAAHLPGVVASYTDVPVIGVPIALEPLKGVDALYSIVQMPAGIPVATVGIGNARNAALLALRILALKYEDLREKLKEYKDRMRQKVIKSDREVNL